MRLPTSSDRPEAVRLLCDMVALAAEAQGTTAELRLIAWIEARGDDEGGFVWLAGVLGYRPSALEDMLRSTLTATPRRQQSILRKLVELYWQALADD
jgi:hypothetical protein